MELHYFFLALLIFLMYFVKTSILSREGFEDGSSQTLEEPEEIYDVKKYLTQKILSLYK